MTAYALLMTLAVSTGPTSDDAHPLPWGFLGHEMAAHAAVLALPASMPDFFRSAGEQLVYLDPEPDRWRNFSMREMDQAFSYDHYIDMENVPTGALDAPDRTRRRLPPVPDPRAVSARGHGIPHVAERDGSD